MKNSVENVNPYIKNKSLTKIFLQGCTWTTKHNIVKMFFLQSLKQKQWTYSDEL